MPTFDLIDGGAAAEQDAVRELIGSVTDRGTRAAADLVPPAALRARVDWSRGDAGQDDDAPPAARSGRRGRRSARPRRRVIVGAGVAAAVVAAAFVVTASPPPKTTVFASAGPWRLAGALVPAGQQPFSQTGATPVVGGDQSLDGVSCPTISVCYATMQTEETTPIDGSFFHRVTGDNLTPGATATYTLTTGAFVSHDSGSTWTPIALPAGLSLNTRLTCPTAVTCMAGAQAGQPNGWDDVRQQLLLITHDAGAHWTQENVPMQPVTGIDPSLDPSIASLQGSFSQLFCFSAQTCLAFGMVPSDQPIGNEPGGDLAQAERASEATVMRTVSMRTDDGGAHWSASVLPWSPTQSGAPGASNAQSATFSCPTENSCVGLQTVIGYLSDATTTTGSEQIAWRVVRTSDGGASWSGTWPSSLPASESLVTQNLACTDPLHCQTEVETRTGQTDGLGILRTADGGTTWQLTPVLPGQFGEWWDLTCPSTQDCWAVGGTTVGTDSTPGSAFALTTNDAGQTWTQVALPSGLTVAKSISCPAPTTCFALGGTQTALTGPLTNVGVLTNAPTAP